MRMVNNGEDGIGLQYGFLKKRLDGSLKGSSLAQKSLKFCKHVAALWTSSRNWF